jgi:superfamily II DNA or RNA helicase
VTVLIDNFITVPQSDLTRPEWNRLFRKLRFSDVDGNIFEPWRYNVGPESFSLPRGAWSILPDRVEYIDKRTFPKYPKLKFTKELDAKLPNGTTFEGQEEAVRAMLAQEQGVVVGQPGMGKSQIVLAFASRVGTNTLILVHTKDVLQQWVDYTKDAIPDVEVGIIQGSKKPTSGQITIAMVQTFKKLIVEDKSWTTKFGAVVLDECHHAAAATFEQILNQMTARYRLGVTASPTRADKKHPYIQFVIGPVIYKKKFKSKVPVRIEAVKTDFYAPYRGTWDWGNLVRRLISDDERNTLIAGRADMEIARGNSVLILSRRIEHLDRIANCMESAVEILTGEIRDADRHRILAAFRNGSVQCVLATQLADEALDITRLNRVFLTHPGKAEGRLIQQIGRALREHPDKVDAIVYDFVDWRVSVLRRQWNQRKHLYRQLKIQVGGGIINGLKARL